MGDTRRTRRAVAEPSAAAELRSVWSRLWWRIADDPPCLKTGWRLAARQVQPQEALERLLGMLGPGVGGATHRPTDATGPGTDSADVVQVVAHGA